MIVRAHSALNTSLVSHSALVDHVHMRSKVAACVTHSMCTMSCSTSPALTLDSLLFCAAACFAFGVAILSGLLPMC